MSQESQILNYLKKGRSLTPKSADRLFDSMRLGARIYGLRRKGIPIRTDIVSTSSGKRFARYSLA